MAQRLVNAVRQIRHANPAYWAGVMFFILVVVGLTYVANAMYGKLMSAQDMPISTLQLTGQRAFSNDKEVQIALGDLSASESFFSLDVGKVKQTVEQVPWIEQAAVRRQWPNGLSIHVTDQQPVAYWNSDRLVNSKGQIFSAQMSRIESPLPHFFAPNNVPQDVLEGYKALLPLFESEGLAIKRVELTERESWQLILEDGARLILGRGNTVIRNARIERFLKVYKHVIPSEKLIDYVDLRYDSGFAVNWLEQPGDKATNE